LASAMLLAVPARAEDMPGEESWLALKPLMFGGREVKQDGSKVIALWAPGRAEDAAVVPIRIRTRIKQTPERFVKTIWLVIDNNPSPFGVKFTMTPQSGRADIETRVRLEHSSPVRVVAELNDGSLWMDSRVVFGSGGCSAPVAKNEQAMKNMGKLKFSVEEEPKSSGTAALAHLRVSHPQFSGIGARALGARFVRTVNVFYADKIVMSAELDFTISENPSFRFYFLPSGKGELRAEIVDTEGLRSEAALAVVVPDVPTAAESAGQ
jgi:sulfur-oxidizing protein SoxY